MHNNAVCPPVYKIPSAIIPRLLRYMGQDMPGWQLVCQTEWQLVCQTECAPLLQCADSIWEALEASPAPCMPSLLVIVGA